MPTEPWYLVFKPVPDARLTLYCLPCAGGGPSMFRDWAALLPPWIELRAVRLPGRPGRHREAPFTHVDPAVDALLTGLGPALTGAYAFVGHSMGAMLAYRLTLALRSRGLPLPQVFAAASWPPRGAPNHIMPDPADGDATFTAALRTLGGIPDELLADASMLRLALPLLRADFALCRSYSYHPAAPLPMPVIAFGGDSDQVTPPATVATWAGEAADYRGLHLFPGGHFFLNDHAAAVADLVVRATPAGPAHTA